MAMVKMESSPSEIVPPALRDNVVEVPAQESGKNSMVFTDLSNEAYHRSPALSSSGMNLLLKCPAKYFYKYVIGGHINDDDQTKEIFGFGTMFHCLILEPELFEKSYKVVPDLNKNTNKWKELNAEAELNGVILVQERLYEQLSNMRESLFSHPIGAYFKKPGRVENSIFWRDESTNVWCKTRPDFMTDNYILDLKTTKSADPDSFQRSLVQYGYFRQAALAIDGMANGINKEAQAVKRNMFLNVCIEKDAPHIVTVFRLSPECIEQGRHEYKKALHLYQKCFRENNWPAYTMAIKNLDLPSWYHDNENFNNLLEG